MSGEDGDLDLPERATLCLLRRWATNLIPTVRPMSLLVSYMAGICMVVYNTIPAGPRTSHLTVGSPW